jgi:hypothetical protein
MAEGTAENRELADSTIEGVSTLMSALSQAPGQIVDGEFGNMVDSINGGMNNIDSLVNTYADRFAEDPKGFILGMGKMMGNELKEEGKSILCQALAKAFMKKNLKSHPNDDPNQFLRHYKVVDGMDGLDFGYTTFLQNGTSNLIQLVVTYDVKVIQFLNVDFTFTFRQCVKASAWGRGASKINPADSMATQDPPNTIWDSGPLARGRYIVAAEKENYEYTDSGHGYDAYIEESNEFVTIVSVDTTTQSGSTADGIEDALNRAFNNMEAGVSNLGEEIKVTDENGNEVTKESDPDTRQYSVVLVVPDDADPAIVQQAIEQFKQDHPGVDVEVKSGYGNPTPPGAGSDEEDGN